MKIRDLLHISSRALLVNKSRSVLTMLGIVIGIASVILMIAVGQAAQNFLLAQVASFGSDLVFISNGRGDETRGGPPSASLKQTLTVKDYQKIESLDWIKASDATIITNDLVSYRGQEKNTRVNGAAPGELPVFGTHLDRGSFITKEDVDASGHVVVLGVDIAANLFGEQDPLTKVIKIGKTNFRVIGIMQPSGTRFFSNLDDQVYIPYTSLLEVYGKNRLNFITVKTGDVRPSEAKDRLRLILRDTHNLDNPSGDLSKDDFRIASQEDAIKNADTIGSILQILLGSIASISLFVAGIGIMNIMYVTVTERTREIGLRKAIGAKPADVLRQFLFEAIMLTVVAGLIGITIGISLTWIAIRIISSFQSGWTFVVPWNGVGIGFSVAVATGVIFGFFPARRAAKLHPIEALRYE